jgi:equilibrative nucleoside transporter 1/2/3
LAHRIFKQRCQVRICSQFSRHHDHLRFVLIGQGGVGLAVALTQFIIAYTVSTRSTNEIEPLATPQEMRTSAFHFFLIVTSFAVIGLISNFILITLPHYRSVIKDAASTQAPAEHEVSKISPTSFQDVNAKVRPLGKWLYISLVLDSLLIKSSYLGIALFYVFFITLAVFPSITGSIVSVTDQSTTSGLGTGGGLGETLSKTELFIPLGFVVFAAGDWIGRAMPQIELFVIHDWKILSVCSAARTVFIVGTPIVSAVRAFD